MSLENFGTFSSFDKLYSGALPLTNTRFISGAPHTFPSEIFKGLLLSNCGGSELRSHKTVINGSHEHKL